MTITTQRSSKPLKAQLVVAAFLFFFAGLSWFLPYGGPYDDGPGISWSATLMIISGTWYVSVKILIWWNHG